ncbi:MAG: alpha/beta hydrolase [Anaerolineae bacterium]|nr:alpha/beta hydrolase [Anaerolineae bacterium]
MINETIQLYPDRPGVTLTTYLLADSPELLNGKKRPAVLVCPGGAYLNCSDREAEPVALRFAGMGYHAFVLRYSIYTLDHPEFNLVNATDMVINPHSTYPSPMRDIGKAFLTIHEHADQWLVDTDKIAVCGFSAGAHNCAMYAVYWHNPVITDYFGAPVSQFKPAAAILAYGIGDFHLMVKPYSNAMLQAVASAANFAYLGTRNPSAELLDTVSPARQVTASTPPTFLWATAADVLVPVENTTRLATALAHAGVPFEVHIFEEGAHGLSLADPSTAGSQQDINPDAAQWIRLAEAWLRKRFLLPILEKPAWMQD